MSKLKRKFTVQEVSSILYEDGLDDEDEKPIFETVYKEIVYTDLEKGSITYEVVIKEIATGKFYSTELGKSQWYDQEKHNAKQDWHEVKEKKKTITYYE